MPQAECPEGIGFPQKGSLYCAVMQPVLSPLGAPCTAPPWATLAAVNLSSGKILWQEPLGTLRNLAPWPITEFVKSSLEMGGPIITASGLIFIAATSDAYIRAIDLENGDELWHAELPATGNAVPMTYTYQGRQYVVIAAGGHFTSPLASSDHVIAFSLPDED